MAAPHFGDVIFDQFLAVQVSTLGIGGWDDEDSFYLKFCLHNASARALLQDQASIDTTAAMAPKANIHSVGDLKNNFCQLSRANISQMQCLLWKLAGPRHLVMALWRIARTAFYSILVERHQIHCFECASRTILKLKPGRPLVFSQTRREVFFSVAGCS